MYCDNYQCDCETKTGILQGGFHFCSDECAAGEQTDHSQTCPCGRVGCAPAATLEDAEPTSRAAPRW
jgi:hypothetical protein